MNNILTPEVGEIYTTQKTKLTGVVKEVVPNRTGSYRVRIQTTTLEMRWTTFVPDKEGEDDTQTL
jgi:hypothetical protein